MTGDGPPGAYNPLDPEQRAERGRLRQAYFRQASLFPAVVLTMTVFCVLALTRTAWAVPYVVHVVVACGIAAAVHTMTTGGQEGRAGPGAFVMVAVATAALLPFVAFTGRIWPSLLVAVPAAIVAIRVLARSRR